MTDERGDHEARLARQRDRMRRHWEEGIPFNRLCGLTVSRWEPDGVRMVVDGDERLGNSLGTLHGGVVAALIDTVASAAVMVADDEIPPRAATTVSMTVQYTGPARGRVTADASCSKRGRRLSYVNVDVRDERGALVAQGMVVVNVAAPR